MTVEKQGKTQTIELILIKALENRLNIFSLYLSQSYA